MYHIGSFGKVRPDINNFYYCISIEIVSPNFIEITCSNIDICLANSTKGTIFKLYILNKVNRKFNDQTLDMWELGELYYEVKMPT